MASRKNNRAPASHRTPKPLIPSEPIFLLRGGQVSKLEPNDVKVNNVGVKAFGLASIPKIWTKPFFVVSGDISPTSDGLLKVLERTGLNRCVRVIVRSSGTTESLDQRGTLESNECVPAEIINTIACLKERLGNAQNECGGVVHWIIQSFIEPLAKGHLSNERRLCKDLRDWVVEVEPSAEYMAETNKIGIRPWRDARPNEPMELACSYRENYSQNLELIAGWAYARLLRIHFEWVWDGHAVYVVQADESRSRNGVLPKTLVQVSVCSVNTSDLEVFRIATSDDFAKYRKLSNASLYRDLGYQIVDFFVHDDEDSIREILVEKLCGEKLAQDLRKLTSRPLVIRTDGRDIPSDKRHMLPRSDELRSFEAAEQWLLNDFRRAINDLEIAESQLCLIAHHFVPATTSVWCQAYPDRRRVRIESLWGIPEGLYWYAHDVFDVDTLVTNIKPDSLRPKKFEFKEKLRYKGQFIAPNSSGEWVLHQTADGPDWQRSIRYGRWIHEIAWTSRQIAVNQNKPVVVMWFVDIPKAVSSHSVMPWYHEEWKSIGNLPNKAAPRKKLPLSTEFIIHTETDWQLIQEKAKSGVPIARVLVDPKEPGLVRDQQFAKGLGELAKNRRFVVELAGGILSHAYYLLVNSGCEVECADLFAIEDEELEFNKLVRDRIPENIAARGENVEFLQLEGEALIAELKRKVIEEAFEVADSKTSQQLVEEIADLREVLDALMSKLGIQEDEVNQKRRQKANSHGVFEKALMLTRTTLSSSLGEDEKQLDDELFTQTLGSICRKISQLEQIPSHNINFHIDKRHDAHGTAERQITMVLPAHAFGYKPQRINFSLENQNGSPHDLMLEVILERVNSELRCKLRLINAPVQMSLPI